MSLSNRDAIKLAVKCYGADLTPQGLVDAAKTFASYVNSELTIKGDAVSAKSAEPLHDYLEKLGDKAEAFAKGKNIKVGDIVRWNNSVNTWEVMAKLTSENLAWVKSSTSNDYRTVRLDHLEVQG